jgi:hypothetical protein
MKKLLLFFLILFFLIAGVYAIIQSNIGRNYVRATLTKALQESGLKVQIEQVEGTLPHQIDLKGVSIEGEGIDLKLAELKLRPILWRLFRKEAAFRDVQAKGVSISNQTPFDFTGQARINAKGLHLKGTLFDWKVKIRFQKEKKKLFFTARNALLEAKGQALLDSHFQLISSHLQIESEELLTHLPFSASGQLQARVLVTSSEEGYKGEASWKIPHLVVENNPIGLVQGKGKAFFKERTLTGSVTAEPFAKALFEWTFRPDGILIGTSELDIENLQSLHIPQLYGKVQAKANWTAINGEQGLHFDAIGSQIYYGPLFAEKISVYSDLIDPFSNIHGLFDLAAEKLKWRHLELDAASFQTTSGEGAQNFQLFAEGNLRHPFELHMDGTWKNHFFVEIEHLNGKFLTTPFALTAPVHFEKTEEAFLLSETELTLGDAKAQLKIDHQAGQTEAYIHCDAIPLDFLSFNPLEVKVAGTLSLDALIHENHQKLQGELKAVIHQIQPFDVKGSFEGKFDRDLLNMKGHLAVHDKPLLETNLALPIHFSLWPFEAEVLYHKESQGEISLNGRIEEFLDFLDLGPHHLEGECQGHLRFKDTLYRPRLEGTLSFTDGTFENYYSGTRLTHIRADLVAEKNILKLNSLTAQDPLGSGTLTATGKMELLQSDFYPFALDLSFTNLQFVEMDLVTAKADGNIHLEGNALSALAQGDLHIQECELFIPDHLPRPLPHLDVIYRHPIHPILPPNGSYKPYPLHLDLNVHTPNRISISGRGLTSEWQGNFHLGGTATSPAAKGTLELIEGQFNFSSRGFKLVDGSLSLSGVEHEMPSLNLAATTEIKGVNIMARLKGPLNNPQITLQSSPPLPLGSIMSYLLFGQDISEIGGFQALQIATSLASLAGTGPDIMESTRKSLGVDRLRIITDPTAEGGEAVALQVGKYVSKGVLVSFTQGTEDSSTNISVEIELKGNFSFQIESDQHQEQGKFTLKWNLNY